VDTGKREKENSFVSEARRNRSDGNFDGINHAIGECFLEEVHRKICNQQCELNVEHRFYRHHPQSAACFGYVKLSSGRVQLCYNVNWKRNIKR
jgi:hypothetical protein